MGKERKLFGTYCSMESLQVLNQGEFKKTKTYLPEHHILKDLFGYNPIFSIPFEDIQQFMVWSALSMPQHPQVLVLFESDEYDSINFLEWLYYIFDSRHTNNKSSNKIKTSSKYREYIVPYITKENIVATVDITSKGFRESDREFLLKLLGDLSTEVTDSLRNTKYKQHKDLEVVNYMDLYLNNRGIFDALSTLQTNASQLKEKDISVLIKRLKHLVFKEGV